MADLEGAGGLLLIAKYCALRLKKTVTGGEVK